MNESLGQICIIMSSRCFGFWEPGYRRVGFEQHWHCSTGTIDLEQKPNRESLGQLEPDCS